jgi:hypothetical protein
VKLLLTQVKFGGFAGTGFALMLGSAEGRVMMGKAWIRLALCAAALGLSAPASATSWVQVDQFNWVDMDSVVRISGGLVSYRSYHGSSPPSGDMTGRVAGVDCTNGRWYWMEGDQLVPVPDEPDLEIYASEGDPTFVKLCR